MFSAKKVILVLLIVSCFLPISATAIQYVSFAQPDTTIQKDIYLYGFNITSTKYEILGQYNTTSTGIEIPNDTDIMFVLKPQYGNPLDEPGSFLNGFVGWLQTNALSLLILAGMAGLLFKRW